jgi:Zn-finger nucleic acid-binding protein
VSTDTHSLKINVSAFVEDFVRGASDDELREKYRVSRSQLSKLVSKLTQLKRISDEEIGRRRENLAVRFGDPEGPPKREDQQGLPVDLDTGLVLHCPSCGAPVERGDERCDYCSAHLDFSLKGKTVNCPHCFTRIAADSRFCMRCAKPIPRSGDEGALLPDRLCPRCEVPMRATTVGDYSIVSCPECTGFFVPSDIFEMMQDNSKRVIFSNEGVHRKPVEVAGSIRYVRCPVCRKMMNRVNFARISGVIVDSCREHGIWFDPGELEKIMEFIALGGLQKARQAETERLKAEERIARIRTGTMTGSEPYAPRYPGGLEEPASILTFPEVITWIGELFRKG